MITSTCDVRPRSIFEAAAAAERLHFGFTAAASHPCQPVRPPVRPPVHPPATQSVAHRATRCCRLPGSPNGLVRIHPPACLSVRPSDRPSLCATGGGGPRTNTRATPPHARAVHAFFVYEERFGFIIAFSTLINRAFIPPSETNPSECVIRPRFRPRTLICLLTHFLLSGRNHRPFTT